jgi:peptidoglycan-N-acetylglucosamine deacetylase
MRLGLLLVVLCAPLMGIHATSAQPAGQIATILGTQSLTMRACPDVACDMMEMLSIGTSVTITGEAQNGFAPVGWNGREGWALGMYLFAANDDFLIQQGVAGCNRVALIFNAGVGEAPSESILNTLTTTDTPATLFAMGWWAETYPNYLREMANAGLVVGSHGNTQTLLTREGDARIVSEVQDSAWVIEQTLGTPPERLYTPYATDSDARVGRIIAEQGWLPIRWTVAAEDYDADDTADEVYNRVMSGIVDGAIVELHLDGPATDQSTAIALPRIIADLEASGFTLVTVPEILLPCGSASSGTSTASAVAVSERRSMTSARVDQTA